MQTDAKMTAQIIRETTIEHLVRAKMPVEEIAEVIKKLYLADKEDFTEEQILEDIYSEQSYQLSDPQKPGRSIHQEVLDWIESNKSNNRVTHLLRIMLRICYADLDLKTRNEKAQCRVTFRRLCDKGILEPDPHTAGTYIVVNHQTDEIDFMGADTTPFNIHFPLGVDELVTIYKKSVIVLAGEPNAGKTAYMLNMARKNMDEHNVMYFSSEMGAAELQVRLKKFPYQLESWKKVRWIAKSGDFSRVIDPNGMNIIDYLEVAKDFYEIGGMLTDIFNALDGGVAVVGLQKPAGRDTGIGGARTLDKARLYMAIEPGVLKIVKGKIWRQENINPNGLYRKFRLGGGANFTKDSEWLV